MIRAAPLHTIHLADAEPGGMECRLVPARTPGVEDRVVIGPITMPMSDFCRLVVHVMTATPVRQDDTDARRSIGDLHSQKPQTTKENA